MFLFIVKVLCGQCKVDTISIHLMFLFIQMTTKLQQTYSYFNTSHVLIHPDAGMPDLRMGIISIHLMFLFIKDLWRDGSTERDFNTSHVLIHRKMEIRQSLTAEISIHLMFLFILWQQAHSGKEESISIHLMFLFIRKATKRFLSRFFISIHLMFLFIQMTTKLQQTYSYFNTSHVLIHLYPVFRSSATSNFNTSHVLIHRQAKTMSRKTYIFQYISCSYSSNAFISFSVFTISQIP